MVVDEATNVEYETLYDGATDFYRQWIFITYKTTDKENINTVFCTSCTIFIINNNKTDQHLRSSLKEHCHTLDGLIIIIY